MNKILDEIEKNGLEAFCRSVLYVQPGGRDYPMIEVLHDDFRFAIEDWSKAATQAITHLILQAELQARANAYYEAADLVSDRPDIYKILWDRRQEALAQLKGGQDE